MTKENIIVCYCIYWLGSSTPTILSPTLLSKNLPLPAGMETPTLALVTHFPALFANKNCERIESRRQCLRRRGPTEPLPN